MRTPIPLPLETVGRLVARVVPRHRVAAAELLPGGLCNTNIRIRLDPDVGLLVLRIYDRDPAACQKEADLYEMVRRTVPVPEVLGVAPEGGDGVGPYAVLRYVDGATFQELRRRGDARALAEASAAIGRTLATIGRHEFPRPGRLEAGPRVGEQLARGSDPIPAFVEASLGRPAFANRLDASFRERLRTLFWSAADRLREATDDHRLVHCDFGSRNLILRPTAGRWEVAGVLDWEFAASGSPLWDVGHFLRYERAGPARSEPHFSTGFRAAGGHLPDDWPRLARLLDLAALCDALASVALPGDVMAELVELIRATVDDRDPVLR